MKVVLALLLVCLPTATAQHSPTMREAGAGGSLSKGPQSLKAAALTTAGGAGVRIHADPVNGTFQALVMVCVTPSGKLAMGCPVIVV